MGLPFANTIAPTARSLRSLLRRFRLTLAFLAVMITANALAGTFSGALSDEALETWGVGQRAVWSGELTRLLTGTFLSHDPDMLVRQILFAALAIGYTEWRWGSGRALVLFVALDIGATLTLLTFIATLPGLGTLGGLNDVGMSMGGFGLIGLAIAGWRQRWLLVALVLLGIGTKVALAFEPLTDSGHVFALGLGYGVGLLLHRSARQGH